MNSLSLRKSMLLVSILMSGFCGIVAELSLFNLGNLLIGGMNVVLTYTMGVMMFFMGLGSLTLRIKHIGRHLYTYFAAIETLLSLVTASSVIAIYFLAGFFPGHNLLWVLLFSAFIGYLIGFEIPLILLINDKLKTPLKDSSSLVLFADYLGSLIAFMLFSHVMLVNFGISKSAMTGGILNWLVALITFTLIGQREKVPVLIKIILPVSALFLGFLFINSDRLMVKAEAVHYRDKITLGRQSEYQKIVMTRGNRISDDPKHSEHMPGRDKRRQPVKKIASVRVKDTVQLELQKFKSYGKEDDVRLYLNGGLQFSTLDEFYYHEILVHPAMFLLGKNTAPLQVLVGGGGDGMALREVLKHENVTHVTVVDLDPEITRLFTVNPEFCRLNDSSFHDSRVTLLNDDMYSYLKKSNNKFDLVIFDFPDPHHDNIAKLYSEQVYQYASESLKKSGFIVTQSTSPYFNRKSFLIIHKTLEKTFPRGVVPYKVYMPTFGVWGFNLASPGYTASEIKSILTNFDPPADTRFLNREVVQASLLWSDLTWQGLRELQVNSVMKPVLVQAYNSLE